MDSPTQIAVKGSWEDLLQQATDLAARENDGCVALWQKVMERLGNLPATRLDAGNGHLRQLRTIAAENLQQFFVYRERYDEALQIIDLLETAVDTANTEHWQHRAVEVLLLASRKEDAIAKARRSAQAAAVDDIDTWGSLVYAAVAEKDFAIGEEALREIERRINRVRKEQGADASKSDSSFLSWLRANFSMAQGLWDEAIAWWTHASTQDKHYEGEIHNIYIKLLRAGQPAKALGLIERDKGNQVRADFWRGLALSRLGKETEGQQYWRRAANTDTSEDDRLRYALTEYFLAHYYLPELRERGLTTNLNIVREVQGLDWHFHYLCALGFAVRADNDNAHIHLAEALLRHRKAGLGAKLPQELWFPFADLLDEQQRKNYAHYFRSQ